jgi:hypothetical protein
MGQAAPNFVRNSMDSSGSTPEVRDGADDRANEL